MKIDCAYDELVDVHKLVPNPKNNNKHPKNQIERLAKIIDFQGQRQPIVVSNRSGFIVKGHGRLEAIKLLGWEKCAVDYQDYESEAQEYADMVADNQIATWAEFDTQMVLDELPELDIDTDMLGMLEIPQIEAEENEVVEDEVPEQVETRCKRGDVWKLGDHRLMCGDSTVITDVEKLMNGQKADMVFTDPPYNVAYEGGSKKREKIKNDEINNFYDFLLDCYSCCSSIMKDGASIYVCHSELERMNFTKAFFDAGFKLSSVIIWAKNNSTFSMNKDYKQKHEPIIYGWKGVGHKWRGGNCEDTLWEIKRPSKSDLHPTMKPIELCARGISNSSEANDIVYEPFGGSGSTLIACEQLNRKCFMMELDEHYCDVIIQRWENLTGKTAERL